LQCVHQFRSVKDIKKSSAYGIANVGAIKDICAVAGNSVKIVSSPEPNNGSHASIKRFPIAEDLAMLDALATIAFKDAILDVYVL
jgi:hypothetical protein